MKYGYSKFSLEILEYCNKEYIINLEQYSIDLLKSEYNLYLKAESSLGRITREETRAKLRNLWINILFSNSKDKTLREFIINSNEKRLDESISRIISYIKNF